MLYPQIKTDLVAAQKAGESKLVGVLKLIISELGYAQVDFKGGELPDAEVVRVLMKEGKKRKEGIEIYEKARSKERADQERYELGVIEKYLPQMMDESQVATEVAKLAQETGLRGGKLMGAVMGKLRGKVDGGVVNKLVNANFPG